MGTRVGAGAWILLVCVSLAAAPLAAAAEEPAPGRRGPSGLDLERQVARRLARLDDRLGLDTFPDGSGLWTARLAAALDYRLRAPDSPGAFAPHLMARLADDLRRLGVERDLDPPPPSVPGAGAAPSPPGRERSERLRRVLETVRLLHGKLDRRGRMVDRGGEPIPLPSALGSDGCGGAPSITEGSVSGSTVGRNSDGHASCGSSSDSPDVWYRYTAAEAGKVTFDTFGSSYDTVLSLHTGCPDNGRDVELACNDDAKGTEQSQITYDMLSGEELWIRVSGFGGTAGSFDLQVDQTIGIEGTITAEESGDPISGATVMLYGEYGYYVDERTTGADGTYLFGGLTDGTYYVRASADGRITELYDDYGCSFFVTFCDPYYDGTPITVSGGVTSGIDLALAPSGAIAGAVTAASGGAGIGAYLELYNGAGSFLDSIYSGADGVYELSNLPAGKYRLVADADSYQDELYDDIPCESGCDVVAGTELAVTGGTTLSGIDFALEELGEITGTLTESGTGDPIVGERVIVVSSSNYFVGSDYTDEDGAYGIAGLDPGTYYVRTTTDEHQDEIYDDIPCPTSCDATTGTGVEVVLDGTTSGIDFVLDRLGEISGTVVETGSGDPLTYGSVDVYDSAGQYAGYGWIRNDGSYRITGLPVGDYYVRTDTYEYGDEVYDDLPCDPSCDVTAGTAVTTVLNSSVTGIDFVLSRLGQISGTVRHTLSGDPVGSARVIAYDGVRAFQRSDSTSYDGSYTIERLPAGSYTVYTDSSTYRNEVYDDLPCSGDCTPGTGAPVDVSFGATTSEIDFSLDRLGVIEGRFVDAETGSSLFERLLLLDEAGTVLGSVWASSGTYRFAGLAAGTYYVKSAYYDYSSGPSYQDELFDDVPCEPTCDLSLGTGLTVGLNTTILGVDFALAPCPVDSYANASGNIYFSMHTEEACERITAGAGTTIGSGADVTFKSGRSIALGDGFTVESGASFRTVIEPSWSDD